MFDLTRKKGCSKIVWLPVHQKAFDSLKHAIASNPVLRSPDFGTLFYLRTDASDCGVRAVLEQNFEDGRHPILYLSKKLSDTEKRLRKNVLQLSGVLSRSEFFLKVDHLWLSRIMLHFSGLI